MLVEENVIYSINPEFDDFDTDTFVLDSIGIDGAFFHRYVNGGDEASTLGYFTNCELEENVLIIA